MGFISTKVQSMTCIFWKQIDMLLLIKRQPGAKTQPCSMQCPSSCLSELSTKGKIENLWWKLFLVLLKLYFLCLVTIIWAGVEHSTIYWLSQKCSCFHPMHNTISITIQCYGWTDPLDDRNVCHAYLKEPHGPKELDLCNSTFWSWTLDEILFPFPCLIRT